MGKEIELLVNGQHRDVDAEPETHLLEVLRNDLGLTGAKYGCGEGQCGACTVLVDGQPTRSCITPVSAVGDKPVTTIEGLEKGGKLHPVQQAFLDEGAMQCGYCVAGMIMNAVGVLQQNPKISDDELIQRMQGNVCRCCGYNRMIAALKRAAASVRGGE